MRYAAARKKIKKGDLIAFTHEEWKTISDIESQIVRIVDQTEYSHVAIAYPMEGRVYVMEAVKPLVRIFPLSQLGDFFWIPLDMAMSEEARIYAHAHVGGPYSNIEAIRGKISHTDPDNNLWQCAEYFRLTRMIDGFPAGKNTPSQVVDDALEMGKPLHKVTQ